MDILSKLLVSLALGVLNYFITRRDLENEVREKIALEASELAKKALAWKADAALSPDGGSGLRVSEQGRDSEIKLSTSDSSPPSGPKNG